MYLAKRLLLLALAGLSLLVAAFGGFRFLIEAGQSPLRYMVQDAAVFAAGALGLFLCWRVGRKLKEGHDAAQEAARRFDGDVLEASMQPVKMVLALLVFLGMAGVSWLIYLDKGDWRLAAGAIVMAAFCALLVPFAWVQLRHRGPTLRMDARGLDHALYGWVPWSDVHGIYLDIKTIRHVKVMRLVLGVSNPARYRSRMPWIARLLSEQLRTPRGRYGTLVLALQSMDVDPLRIVSAAEVLRDRASPPRLRYWTPWMDQESISMGLELAYLESDPEDLSPEEKLRRLEALDPRIRAVAHQLQGRR